MLFLLAVLSVFGSCSCVTCSLNYVFDFFGFEGLVLPCFSAAIRLVMFAMGQMQTAASVSCIQ